MQIKALMFAAALALIGCTTSADAPPPAPLRIGEWTEMTPAPIAIDGEIFEPTCSGAPGSDPAFRFWARRGVSNRLVVFFDGGGACWDDATCMQPGLRENQLEQDWLYKAELLDKDDPRRLDGVFDFANPRNPLRDWSFVFVPYCTGDVHSGARTMTYTDPDGGGRYTIHHRGSDNFRAILAWMREAFDAPDTILVTGSSAGAYGAATQFARIREAFPNGRAVMLGDAGQGVSTPGFITERNANWGYDLPRSVFGDRLPEGMDIVAELAAHFPADRFAQYTTAHDDVQVAFYALMGAQNACSAWTEAMTAALSQRAATPNFRVYLAAGDTHTILRSPLFFTETSGGQPFPDWLEALVDSGEAESRACVRCLAPPAQCRY